MRVNLIALALFVIFISGCGYGGGVGDVAESADWPQIWTVRDYGIGDGCTSRSVPIELHFTRDDAKHWHDEEQAAWKKMGYVDRPTYRSGHSFRAWVNLFWDSHREYFGMLPDGRRGFDYPGLPRWTRGLSKICASNEAVVDAKIDEWVRKGCPELLIAGENDGNMGYCRCDRCIALDADIDGEPFSHNKSDRYVSFWNRLTDKARRIRHDVKVSVFLYSATRRPPRRSKVLYPENMIFSYVPTLHDDDVMADIVGWKAAGVRHFYSRPNYLCIRSALPAGLERYVCEVHHRMLSIGSLGDCYDRDTGQPAQQFTEFAAVYLCAKPQSTFEEIEDAWCAQFGAAKDVVRRYYANVRERCDREWPRLRRYLCENEIEFLDDSHFSRVVHRLHTIQELENDRAILEAFDASAMEGDALRRFNNLKALAKQSVLVMRMFERSTPATRLAVSEYRKAHKESLGYGWLRLYTKGEFWIWGQTPEKVFYENMAVKRYADRLEKSMASPSGPLTSSDPESVRLHEILKATR